MENVYGYLAGYFGWLLTVTELGGGLSLLCSGPSVHIWGTPHVLATIMFIRFRQLPFAGR